MKYERKKVPPEELREPSKSMPALDRYTLQPES